MLALTIQNWLYSPLINVNPTSSLLCYSFSFLFFFFILRIMFFKGTIILLIQTSNTLIQTHNQCDASFPGGPLTTR